MKTSFIEKIEWLADFGVFAVMFLTLPIWIWFYIAFKIGKKIWRLIND
jgi:amino acid permease